LTNLVFNAGEGLPACDRASFPDAPPILINASLPEMVKAKIPRSSEGSPQLLAE
jgi:hypothetical protein